MLTRVFSAALQGVEAIQVEVEVNTGSGNPVVIVVGLPDAAVRESKDRVTTAISNSGFRWPRERTTINLAPADIKKEGPSFDLPIAVGMVAAAERAELPRLERCFVIGELALTGEIRAIKGALPIAVAARDQGMKAVILPAANAAEAAIVEGIEVYGVRNLREAYEFLSRKKELTPVRGSAVERLTAGSSDDVDFSEVKGQHQVKRAIEVAMAGGHNLLLIGDNNPLTKTPASSKCEVTTIFRPLAG
jgi:magnesium chelatase family protein